MLVVIILRTRDGFSYTVKFQSGLTVNGTARTKAAVLAAVCAATEQEEF